MRISIGSKNILIPKEQQANSHSDIDYCRVNMDSANEFPQASIFNEKIDFGQMEFLNEQVGEQKNPHTIIIDVEGYLIQNDFFGKEFACYNPFNGKCWTTLFLPPFQKDMIKKKYEKNITAATHGLTWSQGQLPYSMLFQVVEHFGANFKLYARGKDKIKWMQHFTNHTVQDLELLGCPDAAELPHKYACVYHDTENNSCALNNAIKYGTYFSNFYDMKPKCTVLPKKDLYIGLF